MNDLFVQFKHVVKTYDHVAVLKGVSGAVKRGDIVGVLGKNGAGKTTLLESLLGFAPLASGEITVFDMPPLQLEGTAKQRIGYVPQRDDVLLHMTVKNWLALVRAFYPDWDDSLQNQLLSDWEIPGDKRLLKLSVGQLQKVSIITGICHRPDLIVLDEPVASLDPIARRQFLETLIALTSERAPAIVFSTHIVSDIERIASRVWIMREGDIVIDEEMDVLKEQFVRVHGAPLALEAYKKQFTVLKQHEHRGIQTLLLRDWKPQTAIPDNVRVESLSLEELFVELHK